MKILIPILGFGRAGGYRVLSEFANAWLKAGHEVTFLCPDTSMEPYFPTAASILWVNRNGVIKDKCCTQLEQGARYKLQALFNGLRKVGKGYEIILANDSLTAWPVSLASCGAAKKFYYIQAYEPEYFELAKNFKAKILQWFSMKSYDFNLNQICNAPIYIGYKNVRATEWVPPGIDFELFYPSNLNKKNLRVSQEIVLGCIGRHEPSKGIKYVLDAFEILYAKDQRFRLHVAFGNLPVNWSHPGLIVVMPKSDKELGEFYRSLDIMLAPGIVQFGAPHYPVMEAMASGVPVVTTGYLPADSENSWIIEPSSAVAVVDAICDIVSCLSRQTKVDRALVDISSFEWKCVAKKMSDIFNGSLFVTEVPHV